MTVADFTTEDFKEFVKDSVKEALKELLIDPDQGLELKTALRERLLASGQNARPNLKLEDVSESYA